MKSTTVNPSNYISLPFTAEYANTNYAPIISINYYGPALVSAPYAAEKIKTDLNSNPDIANDLPRSFWLINGYEEAFSLENHNQGSMISKLSITGITLNLSEADALLYYAHHHAGEPQQGGTYAQMEQDVTQWLNYIGLAFLSSQGQKSKHTLTCLSQAENGDLTVLSASSNKPFMTMSDQKQYLTPNLILVENKFVIHKTTNNEKTFFNLNPLESTDILRVEKDFFNTVLLPNAYDELASLQKNYNVLTAKILVPFLINKEFAKNYCETIITQPPEEVAIVLKLINACFKNFPDARQDIYLTLFALTKSFQADADAKKQAIYTAIKTQAVGLANPRTLNSQNIENHVNGHIDANPINETEKTTLIPLTKELQKASANYFNRLKALATTELATAKVKQELADTAPELLFTHAVKAFAQPANHLTFDLPVGKRIYPIPYESLNFIDSTLLKKLSIAGHIQNCINDFIKSDYQDTQAFNALKASLKDPEQRAILIAAREKDKAAEKTTSANEVNNMVNTFNKMSYALATSFQALQATFLENIKFKCVDYLRHLMQKTPDLVFSLENARTLADDVEQPAYLRNKITALLDIIDHANNTQHQSAVSNSNAIITIINSPSFNKTLSEHKHGIFSSLFQNASSTFIQNLQSEIKEYSTYEKKILSPSISPNGAGLP